MVKLENTDLVVLHAYVILNLRVSPVRNPLLSWGTAWGAAQELLAAWSEILPAGCVHGDPAWSSMPLRIVNLP